MDLYAELILEHSKRPVGAGLRDPFDGESHQINPTCGDEVTMRVALDGQRLADVSYDALGCSISVASASILAQDLTGADLAEAGTTYQAVRAMLTSRGTDEGDVEQIGDAVALAGVSRYPARVKCALLPWMALTDALARAGATLPAPAGPESPTATTTQSTP